MTLLRFVAAIAVAVVSTVVVAPPAAHAGTIVHRSAVPAGEAVATGGSFQVTFPIAFNDIEIMAADIPPVPTLVAHLLTGLDQQGLRVSAMEQAGPLPPGSIDGLMEAAAKRPGTSVSEIKRMRDGDIASLSFALTEPKGGSYFRIIQNGRTQYVLTVQFPEAIRDRATRAKDDYFASFKLVKP